MKSVCARGVRAREFQNLKGRRFGLLYICVHLCQSVVLFGMAVKIATFNVNGIRSRLPNLLEWLQRESPDIACLQELKAADDAFPELAIRSAGYESIWHGQKSWNGVAILARGARPVEIRRGLPEGDGDSHSRYLE